MARTHRSDPPDGIHHITNHRAGTEDLFLHDGGRALFLRLLTQAATKHDVGILGYCLMGNHFHLLARCPRQGVSLLMHHVQSRYGRVLRASIGGRGPVFEKRFHNQLIEDDAQLLTAARYIDRNPLELRFNLRSYPWSSYGTYVGLTRPAATTVPVQQRLLLDLVGGSHAYRALVETDMDSDKFRLSDGKRRPRILVEQPDQALARLAAMPSQFTDDSTIRLAATLAAHEAGVFVPDEICDAYGYTPASLRVTLSKARRRREDDSRFLAVCEDRRREICGDAQQRAWTDRTG